MRAIYCPAHGSFCWRVVRDWVLAMAAGLPWRGHCHPRANPGECLIDARDAGRE